MRSAVFQMLTSFLLLVTSEIGFAIAPQKDMIADANMNAQADSLMAGYGTPTGFVHNPASGFYPVKNFYSITYQKGIEDIHMFQGTVLLPLKDYQLGIACNYANLGTLRVFDDYRNETGELKSFFSMSKVNLSRKLDFQKEKSLYWGIGANILFDSFINIASVGAFLDMAAVLNLSHLSLGAVMGKTGYFQSEWNVPSMEFGARYELKKNDILLISSMAYEWQPEVSDVVKVALSYIHKKTVSIKFGFQSYLGPSYQQNRFLSIGMGFIHNGISFDGGYSIDSCFEDPFTVTIGNVRKDEKPEKVEEVKNRNVPPRPRGPGRY